MIPPHCFWAIVRYDDGRPTDRYDLGPIPDIEIMFRQRIAEGKMEPIGTMWGSILELWIESPMFCFNIMPYAQIESGRVLMEAAMKGLAP